MLAPLHDLDWGSCKWETPALLTNNWISLGMWPAVLRSAYACRIYIVTLVCFTYLLTYRHYIRKGTGCCYRRRMEVFFFFSQDEVVKVYGQCVSIPCIFQCLGDNTFVKFSIKNLALKTACPKLTAVWESYQHSEIKHQLKKDSVSL